MTLPQLDSHDEIKPRKGYIYELIIDLLAEHPEGLTAWEIAIMLKLTPNPHRMDVAPRLTEMVDSGRLVEMDEMRMTVTGKKGTVYSLSEKEKALLE